MRKQPKTIPVRSTTLSVVFILSAVLFVALALVSCKSESDARRQTAELKPPPTTQPTVAPVELAAPPPPPSPIPAQKVEGGVAGGVVGGVVGGVPGGRVGNVVYRIMAQKSVADLQAAER